MQVYPRKPPLKILCRAWVSYRDALFFPFLALFRLDMENLVGFGSLLCVLVFLDFCFGEENEGEGIA